MDLIPFPGVQQEEENEPHMEDIILAVFEKVSVLHLLQYLFSRPPYSDLLLHSQVSLCPHLHLQLHHRPEQGLHLRNGHGRVMAFIIIF